MAESAVRARRVENRSENSSYPGWWDYSAGALAAALATKRSEPAISESAAPPRSHAFMPPHEAGAPQTVERITAMK
jgi:hypothetical protein